MLVDWRLGDGGRTFVLKEDDDDELLGRKETPREATDYKLCTSIGSNNVPYSLIIKHSPTHTST